MRLAIGTTSSQSLLYYRGLQRRSPQSVLSAKGEYLRVSLVFVIEFLLPPDLLYGVSSVSNLLQESMRQAQDNLQCYSQDVLQTRSTLSNCSEASSAEHFQSAGLEYAVLQTHPLASK